jgi:diamine N-acetyltransferase
MCGASLRIGTRLPPATDHYFSVAVQYLQGRFGERLAGPIKDGRICAEHVLSKNPSTYARRMKYSRPVLPLAFLLLCLYPCSNEILMQLREATPDDVPAICALERRREFYGLVGSWTEGEHLRCLTDPDVRYLVANYSGQVMGFAILLGMTSPHKSLELKRIVVSTPGKGLGKEMLRLVIRKAFDEYGAHRLWLDVFEHNMRAQRAYAAVGFQREGVLREAVYRGGEYHSLILMSILDREYCESPLHRDDLNSANAAP